MTTRLRELLGKATKGPWVLNPCASLEIATIHGVERIPTEDGLGQTWVYIKTSGDFDYEPATQTANAALIVEAVNTLPALLDALDEARGALDEMINEKCSYMIKNRLGNPEIEHTTKMARKALAKINEVIKNV